MKLDEWLRDQAKAAVAEGNPDRLRMMICSSDAFELRETDPDGAFALFTEGRQIAQRLNEPWWMLHYDKYRVDALVHFKRDFRQVIEMAVQCVLDMNKPGNAAYPGRIGVWDSLVAAYLGVDAEGYAQPIQEALDTLEGEIPPGPSADRYLLLARKRIFALEQRRYGDAYDFTMEELKLASEDTSQDRALHYAPFMFCSLCQVGGAARDWEQVGRWAKAGEDLARTVGHQCERAEATAWLAVAALRGGDRDEGWRLLHIARTTAAGLGMPPKHGYFEALLQYHLAAGDTGGALSAREEELRSLENCGRLLQECRLHVDRCQLLSRMGRLEAGDLENARAAAMNLRQPAQYHSQLDELTATT